MAGKPSSDWSYWLWIVLLANSPPATPPSFSDGCAATVISLWIRVDSALPLIRSIDGDVGLQTAAPHRGKRSLELRPPFAYVTRASKAESFWSRLDCM